MSTVQVSRGGGRLPLTLKSMKIMAINSDCVGSFLSLCSVMSLSIGENLMKALGAVSLLATISWFLFLHIDRINRDYNGSLREYASAFKLKPTKKRKKKNAE